MKKRVRHVNVLHLTENQGIVWLQHSSKGRNPAVEGEGYYRPHASVVWTRADPDGEWRETPYTSVRTAMHDMLYRRNPGTAAEVVEELATGKLIAEREARYARFRQHATLIL